MRIVNNIVAGCAGIAIANVRRLWLVIVLTIVFIFGVVALRLAVADIDPEYSLEERLLRVAWVMPPLVAVFYFVLSILSFIEKFGKIKLATGLIVRASSIGEAYKVGLHWDVGGSQES